MGVLSNRSMGDVDIVAPSTPRMRTTLSAMGLGLAGERAAQSPTSLPLAQGGRTRAETNPGERSR